MVFQVTLVILPFFWRSQDKRDFIENYLQTSPKFIKVGAYATWKALNDYCVGIRLEEAKEIVRQFAPHQLFKPVEAKHRAVMAMIAHGPHCWFQLDTIFLNTITSTGYVLLMIDIFTKFLWAWPMAKTQSSSSWRLSESTIRKEYEIWKKIYPDGKIQFKIHTDNGPEFKGGYDSAFHGEMERLSKESNGKVVHVFGTPYHSWSQGVIERVGKTLKTLIRMFKVQSGSSDWKGDNPSYLPSWSPIIMTLSTHRRISSRHISTN